MNNELLAKRIREFRLEKNLTQAKAAELIGISTINYAKHESGQRCPSLESLLLLSLKFEKPVECFISENRKQMCLSKEQAAHLKALDRKDLISILNQIRELYVAQQK